MVLFGGAVYEIVAQQVQNLTVDLIARACFKGIKDKKTFKGGITGRWAHGWLFHHVRMGIPGRGSVRNRFVPQFSFTSPIFYGTQHCHGN